MRLWLRAGAALVSSAALLLVASCEMGGSADEPTTPAPKDGLASVDPCAVLTPEELTTFALEGPGSPEPSSREPGCYYDGENTSLVLYKNQGETVESYGKKSVWAKYDLTTVVGRSAAQGFTKGATKADICATLFDAGGGVLITQVTDSNDSLDECAESKKIAESIAPRMPE